MQKLKCCSNSCFFCHHSDIMSVINFSHNQTIYLYTYSLPAFLFNCFMNYAVIFFVKTIKSLKQLGQWARWKTMKWEFNEEETILAMPKSW